MTDRVDPLSLPRVTPSKLGDRSRHQPRRRADTNGMPDPRNAYRMTIDGPLLNTIAQAAFKSFVEDAMPSDWRDRVRNMLTDDLERRFPAADMIVLARYELTYRATSVAVICRRNGALEHFGMPPRDLPLRSPRPSVFKVDDVVDTGPIALVPAAAIPFFTARATAEADHADFMAVRDWPRRFTAKSKRPPTWAEIEQAHPRIGAWMAQKRDS